MHPMRIIIEWSEPMLYYTARIYWHGYVDVSDRSDLSAPDLSSCLAQVERAVARRTEEEANG